MTAVDGLQVEPELRARALQGCRRRMGSWGIAPPQVDPLVMDFGLGDFPSVGLIEFWIANEAPAGYCGKYMFVFDGQTCPRHAHRVKHETFFVVRGELKGTLDDGTFGLEAGQTLAIEPGRVHSFAGVGDTLMLELSTPCDAHDNFFENERTRDWLRRGLGE